MAKKVSGFLSANDLFGQGSSFVFLGGETFAAIIRETSLHGSLIVLPRLVTNKSSGSTLKALTYFALEPRVTKLPNIVATEFRG